MAHRTVGAGQSIALTGTATTSSAFKVQSNVLRIVATGGNAYVAIGTDPVATTSDYIVTTQGSESLAMLRMSQRVVGITKGSTTVLEAPEGTQMPFNIGDRVTLDYEGDSKNDSNYTTLINDTKVVGKSRSAGISGDFSEKITVEANTAGVSTAFTPTGNATLFLSNKVSVISPNPTAAAVVYIQQVQTTGSA
tara:strand:- start:779 stop:1357 length:579 start_codon:yes stop_codon:yes gene_type:complete